ncbi:MAG: DegQ family serine endoprotease [Nitrospirota bacterium]
MFGSFIRTLSPVKVIIAVVVALSLQAASAYPAQFWQTIPGSEAQKPIPLTNETVSGLAEKLRPAVVNISVTHLVKSGGVPNTPFSENDPFGDFWKKFYGENEPKEYKKKGLGSGVIINKEGYIITNNHVIQKANDITVILHNKKQYQAKVIGTDVKTDIALIKIDGAEGLSVAPLGDSDSVKEGESVIAIGNPFGLSATVTAGIVSAKGRVIGAGPYDDFIQTDASINPGNSGGPLMNFHGEVIGINTAIIASGQGIGFAVPVNLVKEVVLQLKEKGKVTRGWLGVSIQEVTPELAKSFGLKDVTGALVSNVVAGGPAEKAGLKRGDIILEMDGKVIKDFHDLPRSVAALSPGEKVSFKMLRENKEEKITAVVEELKDEAVAEAAPKEAEKQLGMSLQQVTPAIAKELGMKKAEGIVVTNIDVNGPAAEAGLQRGDVILEVNRKLVNNLNDFREAVQKGEKSLLLLIYRNGSTLYFSLQAQEKK